MNNINSIILTYKDLPFEKKEQIFFLLAEKLEKATNNNDSAKINRIEKALTRVLVKSWNSRTNKAINLALKTIPKNGKDFTEATAKKLIKVLEKTYKGIEKKTSKRVQDDLKSIYKINKEKFSKQFKKNKKSLMFNGWNLDHSSMKVVPHKYAIKSVNEIAIAKQAEFGVIDSFAWENLSRLENVAIGDHFPKTSKVSVSNSIQKNVIQKGLNNTDATALLKQDLTTKLGGNIQGALPSSVAKGQMSVNAYFEGLNVTNVTWARNFSQINHMHEVGIRQVIFNAIIDRLTSQVCSQMDGRVFTIEQAIKHQENVLNAENVEQVKIIAPFTRNLSSFGLKEGQKLNDPETSAALAKAGVMVPPIHFRCRSELQPF